MNSLRVFWALLALLIIGLYGCDTANVVDHNVEMPSHIWGYDRKVKTVIDVADAAQAYNIYFRVEAV
jgi:hypothetical protein